MYKRIGWIIFMVIQCYSTVTLASKVIEYQDALVHPKNFGERVEGKPSILHILYTGENLEDSLKTFSDPKEGVSVHYLISEEGQVYRLVPEDKAAQHAGESHWGKLKNLNQHSIGVALVNVGIRDEEAKKLGFQANFPNYSKAQIATLIVLSQDIIKRFQIKPWNIVGHSDIAPQRKLDPGPVFPWKYLAKKGVGLWPKNEIKKPKKYFSATFIKKLEVYGYELPVLKFKNGVLENSSLVAMKKVIAVFQAHFRPAKIDGMVDSETIEILDRLLDLKVAL